MRREHLVPVFIREVLQARSDGSILASPADAGIVDENVDGPVRRDEIGEHLFHRRAIRNVRDECLRALAARALDLGHHVLRRFRPDVVDSDLGALAREGQSGFAPESGASAGDEHYFVFEFHFYFPSTPLRPRRALFTRAFTLSVSLPAVAASNRAAEPRRRPPPLPLSCPSADRTCSGW